jgi:hypothetical protein
LQRAADTESTQIRFVADRLIRGVDLATTDGLTFVRTAEREAVPQCGSSGAFTVKDPPAAANFVSTGECGLLQHAFDAFSVTIFAAETVRSFGRVSSMA